MISTSPDTSNITIIEPHEFSKLRKYLITKVRPEIEAHPPQPKKIKGVIKTYIIQAYERIGLNLPETTLTKLFQESLNELIGYGPLQPLLEDATVTEIMINGPSNVYVEKSGKLVKSDAYFDDDEHIIQVIEKIVIPLGRRIDKFNPMVDARLPDGSRVNAVIPPAAIDGPSMTIRKFSKDRLGIKDLVQFESITDSMAQFLEACVKAKLNVVISGGTGSGKTTLLNILSSFISSNERIVTIEDAAELQLQQDHVVRLETVAPDVDGRNGVDIRALVRNS
ncbi:MAG: CpaF family protein, partial [Chloroflexi bacterium]|nr:CpaF family protein [Chloroflexota bacterium]